MSKMGRYGKYGEHKRKERLNTKKMTRKNPGIKKDKRRKSNNKVTKFILT